jgi:hypothetical protein
MCDEQPDVHFNCRPSIRDRECAHRRAMHGRRIARVSSDSGLVVDLYSGTDLHSTAYGSSLFSGIFGDKQATRVAARLTAEIERVTPSDAPALIRRRTPRWPCVFIVLGSGVGSAAIALIEHALRA